MLSKMSSSKYNRSSNSRSTQKPKRFQGTITVNPELMGALIGRGGCNIRRICGECGFGTYIKGEPDGKTFTISSYKQDKVLLAAQMLKQDETALVDPTKRSSKPFATLDMDSSCVPHVVGRGGEGLQQVMDKVGDGCYIVHRDGQFHINANTKGDISKAIKLLERVRDEYLDWVNGEAIQRVTRRVQEEKSTTKITAGSFAALASDSDSDESDDEGPEHVNPHSEQFYRMLMQQEGMGEASRFTPTEVQRFANGLKRHQINTSKIGAKMFPQLGAKPNISLKVTEKPKPSGAWAHDATALKDTMVAVAQRATVNHAKPKPVPVKKTQDDGPTHVDLTAYLKKYEGMSWADMADESDTDDDDQDNSAW